MTFPWPQLKAIAEEIKGSHVRSRAEATDIIKDEQSRRNEGVAAMLLSPKRLSWWRRRIIS